jgi:signal transduction histidine kinase
MTHRWRFTVRVRLTLLYAGAFFLAGAALVALMYFYLGQSLDRQLSTRIGDTEQHLSAYLGQPDGHGSIDARARLHDTLAAQYARERADTLRAMLTLSLASLGVVGVAAGGLGWLLAGRALRPLQQITATARRVADRSLHERIALDGPDDEVKDLADTFDAMLERLDRAFDGQSRFVANASHELRTPLTLNRTLIEVALDTDDVPESTRQLGTTLLAVNRRHERLIDGLLTLASSDQRLIENARVDVAAVARHVTTTCADPARQAQVEIRANLERAVVVGDAVLLERLVQNLVDNAIRYNLADGGWAAISSGAADGAAFLAVENTGPIVPDYDIDGLFEPFRRLGSTDRLSDDGQTPSERGAGLGLSIVRSVAHAHGGEVHAESRPGGGLLIRVRIPAASAEDPGLGEQPAGID